MYEEIITTVRAFHGGKTGSKIVTIPKKIRVRLGEEATDLFVVKLDRKNRIIFEPIRRTPRTKGGRELSAAGPEVTKHDSV